MVFRILAPLLLFAFPGPKKAAAQQVFVSSRNSHEVKLYDFQTGAFIKNFVPAGSGGLSFPQEVLWHPDGFLLVTGRGNSAIKKYDGSTGAYLGNFTYGYALDNPTKTTIWKDSLLYVSQWGTVKNKIVRFDLKTGAFVDEFTKIGVPNGDSHAWDATGNLFVPTWGDGLSGRVLKFDTAGVFAGNFVPTSLLDGPVNVWFDGDQNLVVVDWTRGDLLKFNGTTGASLGTILNTSSNLEGFAFDSQGILYLGDWTANKVLRFDFSTHSLTDFITTGGLAAPNSLLIRGETSATSDFFPEKISLDIAPNPAGEQLCIRYFLAEKTGVRLEVFSSTGQLVATLFSGEQGAGRHEFLCSKPALHEPGQNPGLYFVKISACGQAVFKKLVWL